MATTKDFPDRRFIWATFLLLMFMQGILVNHISKCTNAFWYDMSLIQLTVMYMLLLWTAWAWGRKKK